jgi:hypothetical protein
MMSSKARRCQTTLLASLIAILSLGTAEADAQAVQVVPSPSMVTPQGPVPPSVVIDLSEPPASAPAPHPLVCPPHTKWRADCTPVTPR